MKIITSSKNEIFKNLVDLREKKYREKSGLFLVEGLRELERAKACGFELIDLVVDQSVSRNFSDATIELSSNIFPKLTVREDHDGVVGVFKLKKFTKNEFEILAKKKDLTIVALQNVEKPGNLGAIARSAGAFGADAIVCLDSSVDVFNPNVIRGSVGAIFAIPVFQFKSAEFAILAKKAGLVVNAAALTEKAVVLDQQKKSPRSVLLFGNEARGLDDFWLRNADIVTKIPIAENALDSLNLSVAVSIYLYEWKKNSSVFLTPS